MNHYERLGWVLWHINHYRLFNAKSYFYIYIKYLIHKYILLSDQTIQFSTSHLFVHSVNVKQYYVTHR